MPKCSLINKILHLQISTLVFWILWLISVIQFFSVFGKYNYTHIPTERLSDELHKEVATSLVIKKKMPDCSYDTVLQNMKSIENTELPQKYDDFSANGIINGSYAPQDCNPQFSVALLVTYRNRQSQLDIFLPYMHNFLRKQNIHYKIYLIEQQDNKSWNKGALYNIGARHAIAEKYPCLILHDVDLLPLDESNLYACTKQPRHMSASLDKFRYVLPYDHLVGGVLAIRTEHYKTVNGFSNKFKGWGGEDDDFAGRLSAHNLNIVRFPRNMSRYSMLRHRQAEKNEDRLRILSDNARSRTNDGLDSVHYESIVVRHQRLFTQIGVRL